MRDGVAFTKKVALVSSNFGQSANAWRFSPWGCRKAKENNKKLERLLCCSLRRITKHSFSSGRLRSDAFCSCRYTSATGFILSRSEHISLKAHPKNFVMTSFGFRFAKQRKWRQKHKWAEKKTEATLGCLSTNFALQVHSTRSITFHLRKTAFTGGQPRAAQANSSIRHSPANLLVVAG